MTFYENILAVLILFGLFLLGYSKVTKKTLSEITEEIKELFIGKKEEDLDLKW